MLLLLLRAFNDNWKFFNTLLNAIRSNEIQNFIIINKIFTKLRLILFLGIQINPFLKKRCDEMEQIYFEPLLVVIRRCFIGKNISKNKNRKLAFAMIVSYMIW